MSPAFFTTSVTLPAMLPFYSCSALHVMCVSDSASSCQKFISSYSLESHVPTDDDMNKIISFLSSTYMPQQSNCKPQLNSYPGNSGNIRHSDSNPEIFKKQPLSIQRSSPLPGVAHQLEITASNLTSSTKHHSDWQIYANIQVGYTLSTQASFVSCQAIVHSTPYLI